VRFKNFHIWQGRLPHWRADDVTYYVTFRHSRLLDDGERDILLKSILSSESRTLLFQIACVLPERTEMIFKLADTSDVRQIEFAKVIEGAKRKAGKKIIKSTGERYPPFWEESYDRIVRDESEYDERLMAILESPVTAELCESPLDYSQMFVKG
jgi:hypothetical protein